MGQEKQLVASSLIWHETQHQYINSDFLLLWTQPWSWRRPWEQGWTTRSATPRAPPAAWGSLSCSPAGGDTELSPEPPLQQRERSRSLGHTYSEDPLGLATRTHVGVVDVFEHHPGLVVFSHLRHRWRTVTAETHPLRPPGDVCFILGATSKKYVCQTCGHYFHFGSRSVPASSLLFTTASRSFQLVHCWQVNKLIENQKSHKIQETAQICAAPQPCMHACWLGKG